MFYEGQHIMILNLYAGGAYGEGVIIKPSKEIAFKDQWLCSIENGYLTINIEPDRIVDAVKFVEKNRMEYKIVAYLLHHKEGLKDLLKQAAVTMDDSPEFKELQIEAVVDFLVNELTERFNANRTDIEDLLTKDLLRIHFGEYYFNL